jgi:hypothetical protein
LVFYETMPTGELQRGSSVGTQRFQKSGALPDSLGLESVMQLLVYFINALGLFAPPLDVSECESVEFVE